MRFVDAIQSGRVIITDGGIETRLLFGEHPGIELHPILGVAPLVDDAIAEPVLRSIYAGYVQAIEPSGLAAIIGTPTFRASARWLRDAGHNPREIDHLNKAAATRHVRLRDQLGYEPLFIAGVLGPAGDAYTPSDCLPAAVAERYHTAQAHALASAGVDFLFAATFPSVDEALGAANAMASTGLPYVVSYVLGTDARVLDGTGLEDAVAAIDSGASRAPLYHSLSCVHPTVAAQAIRPLGTVAKARVLECKANGSSLPTTELVQLDHPVCDAPVDFAVEMWKLRVEFGVQVLGGCCGTDDQHIAALAALARRRPAPVTDR